MKTIAIAAQRIGVIAGVGLLALGVATWDRALRSAEAARNSSGTMAKINGPYIGGTTISTTAVNARLADIETEITNSLDRSGRGGMTAALRGTDGTVAAPALSFTSEPDSGLYRIGANDFGFAVAGIKKLELTSALFTVTPNVLISGSLTVTGASQLNGSLNTVGPLSTNSTLGVTGNTTLSGASTLVNGSGGAQVFSTGQAAANFNTFGALGGAIYLQDSAASPNNGGAVMFGASQGAFAVIKGLLTAGGSNTAGDLVIATRRLVADATLTESVRFPNAGGITIGATGTAISSSYRGTVVWNPGTIAAGSSATNTIALTGAAAGADCMSSINTPATGVPIACNVTANTCNITILNQSANPLVLGSATFSCRVFNP